MCSGGECNTCRKRRRDYGILDADRQLRRGPMLCEICTSEQARTVDHDHVTGAARGRLCKACNVGLGSFRDSQAIIANACAYLRRVQTDSPASAQWEGWS